MSAHAHAIRAASIVPATAAGGLAAAAFLGPFPPELLLPAVLGAGGLAASVLFPALALPRREGSGHALAAAAFGAVAAVGPAAGAAFAVAAADEGGLLRAGATLAAIAALALALVRARRLPERVVLLGALLLAALPPLGRFIAIALAGEDRPRLAALSPAVAPAAALGQPAPPARTRPEGAHPIVSRVESGTAGLFRPGIPTPLAIEGELAAPPALAGTDLVIVGEEPPFAAAPLRNGRAWLLPVFHGTRPALGLALGDLAAAVDWRPLAPTEEARLLVDPRLPRAPRRPATAVVASLPDSLAPLRTFDAFATAGAAALDAPARERLAAAEVFARERALGPRPEDPSLDPARYDVEPAPALPRDLRRRLAIIAALGSAVVILAALLPGPAALAAPLLAGLLGGAVAFAIAPPARARAAEREVLYLAPGAAVAAERRSIEVAAPHAPAAADIALDPSWDSLEAVLFRRPEPIPYAIVARDRARGPRTVGLALQAGERRIFDAWRPLALAGPIETSRAADGALRITNRTGRDFLEAILVGPHDAALLGGLPDGGTLAIGREVGRAGFSIVRRELEQRGPKWTGAARALAHLLGRSRAPEPGRLVLIGPPARPAVHGVPVEARLSIALVPLGPAGAR